MHAIQGVYDGKMIRPLEPVRANPNVRVIITFMDSEQNNAMSKTRLEDVAGCLKYAGPAKTLADMDAAIEKGVNEQWR
ncbi:MAG: hypothetical protein LC725_09960 [Lentisphaerae bacterium]|nr:hypothetical protein [Lentisphaerota bacterium]